MSSFVYSGRQRIYFLLGMAVLMVGGYFLYFRDMSSLQEGLEAYQQGDFPRAISIYTQLAERDEGTALFSLGVMSERGEGGPVNREQARLWYQRAAEAGNQFAQYNLGQMFSLGRSNKRQPEQAIHYYRLAAEQGYDLAQLRLGQIYANGEGVSRDLDEARRWFKLAAKQDNALAQLELNKLASASSAP